MSTLHDNEPFEIPESLRIQLGELRQYLAGMKIGFAVLVSLGFLLGTSLLLFISDRFNDTSVAIRLSLFVLLMFSVAAIPIAFYRWYWKLRTNYHISKWLRGVDKSIGDRLMGAIELSESSGEQGRSPKLVHAALQQVAKVTAQRDLKAYVKEKQNRWAIRIVASLAVCIGILFGTVPLGIANAIARLSLPLGKLPRYTFTSIESSPSIINVPFGEPFSIDAKLQSISIWKPTQATIVSSDPKRESLFRSFAATRNDDQFHFQLPGETSEKDIQLRIGDYRQSIQIFPTHRPEILNVEARVRLPEYLQRKDTVYVEDLRRGSFDGLQGATVTLHAVATQQIESGTLEQQSPELNLALAIQGDAMTASPFVVSDRNHDFRWTWKDSNGFGGKKPLEITCNSILDNPPLASIKGLSAQQVLLNSEQLNFQIQSSDDYGIKSVGIRWIVAPTQSSKQEVDERIQELKAGDPQSVSLDAIGSFRPLDHGIESGVVDLCAWGIDYYPQRMPTSSAPATILVLTPDQHSQWISNQLDQWQRSALEVRDRELQIFEKNKALHQRVSGGESSRDLSQLLHAQSQEEQANAKRLEALSQVGENLLKVAAKNEEIGVGHLEKWAEMQQVLSTLSKKQMPEVASLLRKAAEQKNENGVSLKTEESSKQSQDTSDNSSEESPPNSNPKQQRLSLPQTTIAGPSKASNDPNDLRTVQNPQQELTQEAIHAQEVLLAEFEKLSEEMNSILGNLEASTFVKRLKAASRAQDKLADSLRKSLSLQYSSSIDPQSSDRRTTPDSLEGMLSLGMQQAKASGSDLANIVDDMDAFFERRRTDGLRMVLNDIKRTKAVASITKLGDDIAIEQGMSVAQSEYWADTMDRWADELVDPACKGNCPGSKSSDSLPPSVILESLRLLEGQVDLREQTRVANQRSKSSDELGRQKEGNRLAILQEQLDNRTDAILLRIAELPNASSSFENEIRLFEQVGAWMVDSAKRLRIPDTGPEEIAVQTEIIEALLKSKRINPKGGGGSSGGAPGGGGQGEAIDSALALLGIGTNVQEVREKREVEQSTGNSGSILPEEYRKGIDEYFLQLEQNRSRMKGSE